MSKCMLRLKFLLISGDFLPSETILVNDGDGIQPG